MSGPLITPHGVFGINQNVKNSIEHLDEDTLIYPAGNQLVFYHAERSVQKFLHIKQGQGMSCMALLREFQLMAVGVKTEGAPQLLGIELENPKKYKIFTANEGHPGMEFIDVCFSPDAKYLVAQTGAPEWNIYVWLWEKEKMVGTFKTSLQGAEVTRISCNPFGSHHHKVCITGNKYIQILKIEDQIRIDNRQRVEYDITSHVWLSPTRIMAGTSDAKLLVIENGNVVEELVTSSSMDETIMYSIDHIMVIAEGLFLTTSTGTCMLYHREDDKLGQKWLDFTIDASRISAVSLSPSCNAIVCVTRHSQLFRVPLDGDYQKEEGKSIKCEPITQACHQGPILGMSVCARKHVLATCGQDKTVRIWNYDHSSVEVCKTFPDCPQSIALHPSGFLCMIGFPEHVTMMNILLNDLKPMWQSNILGCREVQFSHGGHYFAIVFGPTILIHSTWNQKQICLLKGHSGRVKSIQFSSDDCKLTSCVADGRVYRWDIMTGTKEWEYDFKTHLYSNLCITPDGKYAHIATADGLLKSVGESGGLTVKEFNLKSVMGQVLLAPSGRMFIGGGAKGIIQSTSYPFPVQTKKNIDQGLFDASIDTQCHYTPISQMVLSFDETRLFTASDDGCIWVYKVQTRAGDKVSKKDIVVSNEVLLTRTDYQHRLSTIASLEKQVEELRATNHDTLTKRDEFYNDKLRKLSEKFEKEVETHKETVDSLQQERESGKPVKVEQMTDLKNKNITELQNTKRKFDQRIEIEYEKYKAITSRYQALGIEKENQLNEVERMHQEKVAEITQFYDQRIQQTLDYAQELKDGLNREDGKTEERLRDIEADVEQEILQLQFQYEKKIREEREAMSDIHQENANIITTFAKLNKDIQEKKTEIVRLTQGEAKLLENIKGLRQEISVIKQEAIRDETVIEKENRMTDLRKKNQELEKFRFVLESKIKELEKKLVPHENNIIRLAGVLRAYDEEITDYQSTQGQLNMQKQDVCMKLFAEEKKLACEKRKSNQLQDTLKMIESDVYDIQKVHDSLPELKKTLIRLSIKYNNLETEPVNCEETKPKMQFGKKPLLMASKSEPIIINDEAKKRNHLESTIHKLQGRLGRVHEAKRRQNAKLVNEGSDLNQERNYLKVKAQKVMQEL